MTKTQKGFYYALLVIVSAVFAFSGFSKVTGNPMVAAGFAVAHLPIWFMYFIGVAEIAGAIGLWIRPLAKWAAGGLFIILAGAVVTTAIYVSVSLALFPLITAVALGIVVWLGGKRGVKVLVQAA